MTKYSLTTPPAQINQKNKNNSVLSDEFRALTKKYSRDNILEDFCKHRQMPEISINSGIRPSWIYSLSVTEAWKYNIYALFLPRWPFFLSSTAIFWLSCLFFFLICVSDRHIQHFCWNPFFSQSSSHCLLSPWAFLSVDKGDSSCTHKRSNSSSRI